MISNNNLKKIHIKQKIAFLILGTVLWIAGVIILIIIPQINSINDLGERIKNHKIYLEAQYENKINEQKNKKKLEIIEKEIKKIDQMFISQNRELEFITTLEEIASRHNIEQKISLEDNNQKEKNHKSYKKNRLQLTSQGTFSDLLNYLMDIESLNYYINIQSIEFVSENDENKNRYIPAIIQQENINNNNQIMCKITANTYWK